MGGIQQAALSLLAELARRIGCTYLSDLRFLLRNVHGKQHELPDGSTWHGPERKWHDSCRVF